MKTVDVDSYVASLYHVAIEAYINTLNGVTFEGHGTFTSAPMQANEQDPTRTYPVQRDVTGWILSGSFGYLVIEPPHADGTGGGRARIKTRPDMVEDPDYPYAYSKMHFVYEFDAVRQHLRDVFRDLDRLPDPAGFATPIEEVAAAISALSLDYVQDPAKSSSSSAGGGTAKQVFGNLASSLKPSLESVRYGLTNTEHFDGLAVVPLVERYTTRLDTANIGVISLMLTHCALICGEKELWERADRSLLAILEKAREGFAAAAARKQVEVDWSTVLLVAGAALQGLSIATSLCPATIAAGPILELGSFALTTIGNGIATDDDQCQASQTDETLDTYAEVRSFLDRAVDQLRLDILNEESLMNENAKGNLGQIMSQSNRLDISGPIFDDENRADVGLRWDPISADTIAGKLAEAAPYYEQAASHLSKSSIWDAAARPYLLGVSRNGPAEFVDELGTYERSLVLALSAELDEGSSKVSEANRMFKAYEGGTLETVAALESAVDLSPFATLASDSTGGNPLAAGAAPPAPLHEKPFDIRSIMGG